ncbi:MAG: beta-galactosidase trimerization domain-containing protein [Cytophagales bacterium]|nr:beta-galactosidase trimerization domain-containing protein [Bernardetiaceae bacterium]MDW8206122.1 beta-galactosidase trimerization domain-containing protein [Cytophagales bacterium]
MKRRDFLQKSSLTAASAMVLAGQPLPLTANNLVVGEQLRETPLGESLPLRFRQVHLDFHTSGQIPDVAADFDPERFADTLKKAYVNSVTLFGRCHHGYIYHQTDKFPERRHPYNKHPKLLEEQIEACHKRNIRTPIYVTVQWDEFTAREHPEWLMRDEQGRPFAFGNGTFDPGFYEHLCIHTPYLDFLKAYLQELFEKVPVQGLFLDIHHIYPNANEACLAGMRKRGMDASKAANRLAYYQEVMENYKRDMTAFIRQLDKKCAIFYNGGHIGPAIRSTLPTYTHLELESLPSGGWGYLHFPLTVRYARTLGKDTMGMTGKFHTSWGDFHSLKNQAALEYECFMMLAMGAKCSVGDQLHPRGVLDAATYDLIGKVYAQVAQKEAWCEEATAVTEIGVLSTEEFDAKETQGESSRTPETMMGVVRMLQEGKHQFDVLDSQSDFSTYKVLILPDRIPVEGALKTKLERFIAQGGGMIASHYAGLTPDYKSFALSEFGLRLKGAAPFSPDFIASEGKGITAGLPTTELVMYMQGTETELSGAQALLMTHVPYFNRTWEHFSSHKHTPSSGKTGYPAVTKNGKVIYFAHPVFKQYARNAPRWCREMVLNALKILLPEPLVQLPNAPTATIAALNEQPSKSRYVLHLLHYVPERRGSDFDVIEDVLPVNNLTVSLRLPRPPKRIAIVPQGQTLSFRQQNGSIVFTLPTLRGHQMVEIRYA